MRAAETIVAVASPPGRSARAVVRVSGSATAALLSRHAGVAGFRRGVHVGRVGVGGAGLPAIVIAFPGPRSYTGEDAAEVQTPGNPALVSRVVAMLAATPGVRIAHPGEFSARAYLAGRLSLEQAEGVAAVIAAQTAAQLAAAKELMSGRAGASYRAMAEELATLAALVEAGIDFTDQEDVRAISQSELSRRVGLLRETLDRHLGPPRAEESASGLPRVALVGRPNAGKSTLFNALLGRARSVESPVAGTTRDAIAERLDLSRDLPGAGEVELVDLAGLDRSVAAGATDRAAQSAAEREAAGAEIVLHCDPSGVFPALAVRGRVLRVRTKADIPASGPSPAAIAVCALDGWNLPLLRRAIADAAWGSRSDAPAMAAPRHARALAAARAALAGPADMGSPELAAATLRAALDAIGELTGRVSPDDVLGRVFAAFCVGK